MSKKVYYTAYQANQYAELKALEQERARHMMLRNDYIDRGLKQAAAYEWQVIGKMSDDIDALGDKIINDRKAISAELLKTLLCAYMAYVFAMEFESEIKKRTGYIEKDLHEDIQDMIGKVKEIALCIDNAGTTRHSWSFSDLTDELEDWFQDTLSPKVNEIIDKYSEKKEFEKLY